MAKTSRNAQDSRGVRTTGAALPDEVVDLVKIAKRTPLLTADEEKELGRRVAQGDEEAHQKMVEANLRLVITMAVKQFNQGQTHPLSLADLIRKGHFAVARAAHRFDPNVGYRFGTYASFWIRNAMKRAVADAVTAQASDNQPQANTD